MSKPGGGALSRACLQAHSKNVRQELALQAELKKLDKLKARHMRTLSKDSALAHQHASSRSPSPPSHRQEGGSPGPRRGSCFARLEAGDGQVGVGVGVGAGLARPSTASPHTARSRRPGSSVQRAGVERHGQVPTIVISQEADTRTHVRAGSRQRRRGGGGPGSQCSGSGSGSGSGSDADSRSPSLSPSPRALLDVRHAAAQPRRNSAPALMLPPSSSPLSRGSRGSSPSRGADRRVGGAARAGSADRRGSLSVGDGGKLTAALGRRRSADVGVVQRSTSPSLARQWEELKDCRYLRIPLATD